MTSLHPVLSRSLWLGLGAAALLVAGCANHPKNTSGITSLSGAEQVPPVTTNASGTTTISASPSRCPGGSGNCPMVHGMVNTSGITATAAHIHHAAAGKNGPPIVTLVKTGPNSWQVPQGTTLTDAQYQAYWDGLLYVNVHSDANAGGELRAQLKP